jgi:hypothetical protein
MSIIGRPLINPSHWEECRCWALFLRISFGCVLSESDVGRLQFFCVMSEVTGLNLGVPSIVITMHVGAATTS